jgi:hypothetical protein
MAVFVCQEEGGHDAAWRTVGRPWRAVLASLVGRPKEGALYWRGGAGLQVAAWRVARGEKGGRAGASAWRPKEEERWEKDGKKEKGEKGKRKRRKQKGK